MKLDIAKNQVESGSQEVTSRKMTIRSQDMHIIINILRSKMYSNPIRTICQEIMSNARDAHREYGNPNTPIEIKLPDKYDPTFYIKDFGVGITPDRMWDVFINYGASTKRNDNIETGGFGLGAKSPFAYTDQFSIISVTPDENNNLITRQYVAVIKGESGYVDEVLSRPSTDNEYRGTTISIPVNPNNFSSFRQWVINTAEYWDIKPIVKSKDEKIEWPKHDNMFEADNGKWTIEHVSKFNDNSPKAVVDGIVYPINYNSIVNYNDKNKNEELYKLKNYNIRLFFNIGEIQLTATREEIDYSNEETVNLIRNRLKEIIDELIKKISKKIDHCQNLWEAYFEWAKLRHDINCIINSIQWKGITVNNHCINTGRSSIYKFERSRNTYDGIKRSTNCSINLGNDINRVLLAIDDFDYVNPSRSKIAYLFEKNPNVDFIYVLKFHDYINKDYQGNEIKKSAKEIFAEDNKVCHFDKMNYIDLATTPKRKIKRSKNNSNNKRTYTKGRKLSNNGYNYNTSWKEVEEIDIENGSGYYVELYNKESYLEPNEKKYISRLDLINIKRIFNVEVYGIQRRYIKKLGKGWKPFIQLIDQKLKELDQKTIEILEDNDKNNNQFSYDKLIISNSIFKDILQDHSLNQKTKDLFNEWKELSALDKRKNTDLIHMEILEKYSNFQPSKKNIKINNKNIKYFYDLIYNKYHLLFYILKNNCYNYYYNKSLLRQDIINYLNCKENNY